MNGVLLIDKQSGISSYDVIRKIKTEFKRAGIWPKIGHAGTLDPFATGLLTILIGRGTKLSDSIMHQDKEYIVTAEFGFETDTQDVTGEIVHESSPEMINKGLALESLAQLCRQFVGEIDQMPPAYSAKKINGQKAYSLARNGQQVNLQTKKVNIYAFDVIEIAWPRVKFKVKCSSGTYIRTLIRDLGEISGLYATAVELRRSAVGKLSIDDALSSESITIENINQSLISENI